MPVGVNGDCYDRFLVRVDEMLESIKIIQKLIHMYQLAPRSLNLSLRKRTMHR